MKQWERYESTPLHTWGKMMYGLYVNPL